MEVVTEQQIKEWALKKPDERKINFKRNYPEDKCGCLMVQYARDRLSDVEYDSCGFSGWWKYNSGVNYKVAELEGFGFCKWGTSHTTFKTLKEAMLNE